MATFFWPNSTREAAHNMSLSWLGASIAIALALPAAGLFINCSTGRRVTT